MILEDYLKETREEKLMEEYKAKISTRIAKLNELINSQAEETETTIDGMENIPDNNIELQNALEEKDKLLNEENVINNAMILLRQRRVNYILGYVRFNGARECKDIDFDQVHKTLDSLKANSNNFREARKEIIQRREKYAPMIEAYYKLKTLDNGADEISKYLKSYDQDIVNQIYEKKKEYIQVLKEEKQKKQALEERPKGLMSKIIFRFTSSKRRKELEDLQYKSGHITGKINELLRELPQPSWGRNEFYPVKSKFSPSDKTGRNKSTEERNINDPAYEGLDMKFYTPNFAEYGLLGTSIQEANSILRGDVKFSEEYRQAEKSINDGIEKYKRETGADFLNPFSSLEENMESHNLIRSYEK